MGQPNASFWAPFFIVVLGVCWSVAYVVSAIWQPDFEPEAVLLIEPLLYPVVVVGALVLWNLRRHWRPGASDLDDMEDPVGLLDRRRWVLVVSLPVYGAAIYIFGFVVPTLIYSVAMCVILGARRVFVVAAIAIGIQLLIWIGFVKFLSVPLPLWP